MDDNERNLIAQILMIEREQKRRKKTYALARYNRGKLIHKKQMEFHCCKKKNRWVFGGNRSGKTECGAVEAIWWARGIHPYRKNRKDVQGWVVSPTFEVQKEVAQAKLLHYLPPEWIEDIVMQSGKKASPEYGVISQIVIRNVFGGLSTIGFKSSEMGREKFQGTSLDFVWFDEEPPEDIYDECRMRVLDKKGEIWGTMTPLKGLTWVYDVIYLNAYNSEDVWSIAVSWEDNPFLDSEEVRKLAESMSEEQQQSRRFGKFTASAGLVYPEFDSSVHVIEPRNLPIEWYDNISIDPGLNNPTSCHFYAMDFDGNIYVIAEHYEKGKEVEHHANRIFEIAKQLNWHYDGKGRLNALIDSASNQRTLSGTKSVAELFYERGIVVNTRVDKDLWSGIARIKSLFAARPPKIFIFSNCVELIKEIKGYWWQNGDHPKKVNDHALDELRYYVMSKPKPPSKPPEHRSAISIDKNKLILRRKRDVR